MLRPVTQMRTEEAIATKGEKLGSSLQTCLQVVRYVLVNIQGASWKIPAVAFLGLVGTAVAIMIPLLNGRIINALVAGSGGQFKKYLLLLGVAFLMQVVLMLAHQSVLIRIEEGFARRLRGQVFRGVLQMNLRTAEGYSVGDLQSRVVNDSGIVKTVLSTFVLQPTYDVLTLFGVAALLYRMNRTLMVLTVIWTPLVFLLSQYLAPRISGATKNIRESIAGVQSSLQSWMSRLVPVWAFRLESAAAARFEDTNSKLTRSSIRAGILSLKGNAGSLLIVSLPSFLISAYGGYLVLIRILTIGELVAFLAYFSYFNAPIQRLAGLVMTTVPSLSPVWQRCHALLPPAQKGERDTTRVPPDVIALVAEQVAFRFAPTAQFQLTVPDFYLHSGEIVGVTGPNGSGKSTLARLLSGLYQPNSGEVRVETASSLSGRPISLREVAGYLPQQSAIFDGTLLENVTGFDPHPRMDQIEEISRELGMDDLILSLDRGWSEVLNGGKGATLSGGQIQRITLAALLYRNLPILVLDEPTASLDEDVLALFKRLVLSRKGRASVIMVTHSRELLSLCDRVYGVSPCSGHPGRYALLPAEIERSQSVSSAATDCSVTQTKCAVARMGAQL
ncbi:MAG: ABC transporter ATP-binding protein [Terracidiphilus sp.]